MQEAGDVDRLHLRMKDSKKRYLDMYCSLSIGSSGAVLLALWVTFISNNFLCCLRNFKNLFAGHFHVKLKVSSL